jgi:hypothetical protein
MLSSNKKEQDDKICVGDISIDEGGISNHFIHLYKMDKKEQGKLTLLQKFPYEHEYQYIDSLLELNQTTLISSSYSYGSNEDNSLVRSPSSGNVIVVWSKANIASSSPYKPQQRITRKEAEESDGACKLVRLNEEEFASLSNSFSYFVLIWTRKSSQREGKEFAIKQKIKVFCGNSSDRLLYIPIANELICGSGSIHIFSSSSSFLFEKRQEITCSGVRSSVSSLVELITNDNNNQDKTVEFASGHMCGEIKIWSKQILNSKYYSLLRKLKPFNNDQWVYDLLFLNEFNCLISCCCQEDKIVIYKNKGEKEEKEELKHEGLSKLAKLKNGVFASGGGRGLNQCLRIWTPSIY